MDDARILSQCVTIDKKICFLSTVMKYFHKDSLRTVSLEPKLQQAMLTPTIFEGFWVF
jgi:hypothetical protein